MTSGGRGKRGLSAEERALWKGITRGIKPIRKKLAAEEDASPDEAPAAKADTSARSTRPSPKRAESKPALKPPPALAPLGRRMKQRVARGKDAVDGRLDLHGFTQAEAHGALLHFLHAAQARGAKLVIVITGKGRGSGEGGVLKRQVPLWLSLPEFRALVIGFEDAHRTHGGEGALYVRLRRAR
jgi:DNA-nicking Smr family endonuclease